MTASGYNQVLVMTDNFTKCAEAVPCTTASAEETCDHLINTINSFPGRAQERAYETLTDGSSSLHDIPSPDKWLSGKAE